MQLFQKIFLMLVITSISTSSFASSNQYECTVDDLIMFGDDSDFIAKNMRKRFLITFDDERVYVTSLSNEFANSQAIYTIVNRALSDIYAVNLSTVSINTIALSENYFEGSYNTTIIRQSTLGATVWKLDCE